MVEGGGGNVCVPLLECGDVCEKGSVFKKGKGGRDIYSPQPSQPPSNTPTHPPTHPHTENTPTHSGHSEGVFFSPLIWTHICL